MSLLTEINKEINEMSLLHANITKVLEAKFEEDDRSAIYETAAEVLKSALQSIQNGQPVEDPALIGGLLVLAKGEVRQDLNVDQHRLGLYANYAGRNDRVNQQLRQYGAGAKIDASRLQTDEQYRNDLMKRLQRLVGAYDQVARQAQQGAEQITATPAAAPRQASAATQTRAAPARAQGM